MFMLNDKVCYVYIISTLNTSHCWICLGLDDARNTARLAWRMINDGCVMQITKSLTAVTDLLLIPTSEW